MIKPLRFTNHSDALSCLRQEIQQAVVEGAFIRAVEFKADLDFDNGNAVVWSVYVRRGTPL